MPWCAFGGTNFSQFFCSGFFSRKFFVWEVFISFSRGEAALPFLSALIFTRLYIFSRVLFAMICGTVKLSSQKSFVRFKSLSSDFHRLLRTSSMFTVYFGR